MFKTIRSGRYGNPKRELRESRNRCAFGGPIVEEEAAARDDEVQVRQWGKAESGASREYLGNEQLLSKGRRKRLVGKDKEPEDGEHSIRELREAVWGRRNSEAVQN